MGNNNLENELGVDIEWKLYGTGPEMVRAFRDSILDIGYMGLPPAIIGISQNVPIKCVAGGHVEGTIMVASKNYKSITELDGNIEKTLTQFKRLDIGVPSKGSIHDVILNHYLKKYGLLNDITVKNYSQAEFIAKDMQDELINAGVGTPALAAFAETLFDSHLIIRSQDLWENNPSYGIFFHEDILNNYPNYVINFLKNHKSASTLLRETPESAAEIISKTFEIISKKFAETVLNISPKYCISLSDGYVNSTMEFVKVLKRLGYIEQELNVKDIFDFKFVEKVHPEKSHY
jgi:NitT/TauT family transport system substrate-binding protein